VSLLNPKVIRDLELPATASPWSSAGLEFPADRTMAAI
jgi:hypothetical protein